MAVYPVSIAADRWGQVTAVATVASAVAAMLALNGTVRLTQLRRHPVRHRAGARVAEAVHLHVQRPSQFPH
jgi:hypothetical protein